MSELLARLIELRRRVPPPPPGAQGPSLAQRFLVPPFSVLDARQGYWQDRKRQWLALGIQSELGRGVNLGDVSASVAGVRDPAEVAAWNEKRRAAGAARRAGDGLLGISAQARSHYDPRKANSFNSGQPGTLQARLKQTPTANGLTVHATCDAYRKEGEEVTAAQGGTSIFDPVLCELAYRWFCPRAGRVLDPFAGGSVRGIVAATLGRSYVGIDLRQEQADANHAQKDYICPYTNLLWEVGDARNVRELVPGQYDFLFSCPPYADLERYSDDPRDLSTMSYSQFLEAYRHIIAESCSMLADDSFACFVVGDVRDRTTGNYRNFVGDTVNAFYSAGLELYNEAILVTSVGSLPIRVGAQFRGYRKLGKTHQNVLVFLKGDAAAATEKCGEVDLDDLEMPAYRQGALAVCLEDCAGLGSTKYLVGTEKVVRVEFSSIESALLVDVIGGEARENGIDLPRVWVGIDGVWRRYEWDEELSYFVGGEVYLNKAFFPDAPRPTQEKPPVKRMRGT